MKTSASSNSSTYNTHQDFQKFSWMKSIIFFFSPPPSARNLIASDNVEIAARQLRDHLQQRNISPNQLTDGIMVPLYWAVNSERCKQAAFVPLLLQYGADPNYPQYPDGSYKGKIIYSRPLDVFFLKERFNQALAKLLLTYGADYRFYLPDVDESYLTDNIKWMRDQSPRYLALPNVLRKANEYFDEEEYEKAKTAYEEAIALLETFEQEEKDKKDDVEYGYHINYENDYRIRADYCREKIQLCSQRLDAEKLSKDDGGDDASETKSLLKMKKTV